MPTVDSKEIIEKIISNDGHYDDDPVVIAVHEYVNQAGRKSYHLAYSQTDVINLISSPFCRDIKQLWPL